MQLRFLWIVGALVLAVGCGPSLYLPEGDAEAGRKAFAALECHHCHSVLGEDFPAPVADPPVPFVLGSPMEKKSRQYLAESIIAPSHRFAKPRPEIIYDSPPVIVERKYENIKEGEKSRMGDFDDAMTVGEWFDLVAYLDSLQNRTVEEAGRY